MFSILETAFRKYSLREQKPTLLLLNYKCVPVSKDSFLEMICPMFQGNQCLGKYELIRVLSRRLSGLLCHMPNLKMHHSFSENVSSYYIRSVFQGENDP